MGERYDVLVTAGDGVFPLTALAEGKGKSALAVLRTGSGTAPTAGTRPTELDGPPLMADALKPAESAALAPREPDRTVQLRLTGSMSRYNWAFDGAPYTPDQRHPVKAGERVRLEFRNATPMWHPLHLHGHTFALGGGAAWGPQGHLDPAARRDADGRFRRGQSRPVDDALPQRLPLGIRDDDGARLPALGPERPGQARKQAGARTSRQKDD